MNGIRILAPVLVTVGAVLTLGCGNAPSSRNAQAPASAEPIITMTPQTAAVLKVIISETASDAPLYLRVRVVMGGCAGFMQKLDLDAAPAPATDYLFESAGIRMVVEKRQVEMLRGTQLEYVEEKKGFNVKNPNLEGESLKKWLPILHAEAPPPVASGPELAERIAEFRTMIRENPKNELAHFRLGQFLMQDGQFAEAAASFEQAAELAPRFVKAHALLGECLIRSNQKPRAVLALTKGLQLADQENDDDGRRAMTGLLAEIGEAVPVGKQSGNR